MTTHDMINEQLKIASEQSRPDTERFWRAVRIHVLSGVAYDIALRWVAHQLGNGEPDKCRLEKRSVAERVY